MPDILEKLRPDCDLQCYFQRPSAIAAFSETSATGFTLSGSWRQQYDWAVVEWNRDNVFEHPAFRNLPDSDLSELTLTYEESRTNCIPINSDFRGGVEWQYLRVWVGSESQPRLIDLLAHATAVEGAPAAATAELELTGTPTAGDSVGVTWLTEHYYHDVVAGDTLAQIVNAIAYAINGSSGTVHAAANGAELTLTAVAAGANWNHVGVYGYVSGARSEQWSPWFTTFGGGVSPWRWRVELDFSNLRDKDSNPVAMTDVRKMRWTYAADVQAGSFVRSEFAVEVSNWSISGTNRAYQVAGQGSRRIENDAPEIQYSGTWTRGQGNFSGGSIESTDTAGSGFTVTYRASGEHTLYLGTRGTFNGGEIEVTVDSLPAVTKSLLIAGEDVLMRLPLGTLGAGDHSVSVSLLSGGGTFYFDFLEMAAPTTTLRTVSGETRVTLATDWDTDHSICVAPERTAWMIYSLGFRGRQNHYVGALWFYEMVRAGHQYAAGTVTFSGTPVSGWGEVTTVTIARAGDPASAFDITHMHLPGETAETIAKAFELWINHEFMPLWASASGGVLMLTAREMGVSGNTLTVKAYTTSAGFTVSPTVETPLAGGTDGEWRTDLSATPRLNRAVRDWTRSFFAALHGYGMEAVAALSMELQHGDPSEAAGIAQRCPAGDAVMLNTPALQTNFSPTSLGFWREAYRDVAQLMQEAGLTPYLQFGETQWWYNRDERSGMPYYDAYTQSAFYAAYGRNMAVITEPTANPAEYPDEAAFLPRQIGAFTSAVMTYVRASYANCRFEALYPLDVNESAFNHVINYPEADWTSVTLDCLKTESFGFTYGRDLDKGRTSIALPGGKGFPAAKSAHLIGLSYPDAPWLKEMRLAQAAPVESVVLFALDQFCLIGYAAPMPVLSRRSAFQG